MTPTRIFYLLFCTCLLFACTTKTNRAYSGSARGNSEVAVVKGAHKWAFLSNKDTGVAAVDGKELVSSVEELVYLTEVVPGTHSLTIRQDRWGLNSGDRQSCSVEIMNCYLQGGHTYKIAFIGGEPAPLNIKGVLVDAGTDGEACQGHAECR